jgi:hypothetical protein
MNTRAISKSRRANSKPNYCDGEIVDYAKTVAEIAGLKGLKADKEADRKEFRREVLERVLKFKKR